MIKAALRDTLVYGLASILTRGLAIFLLPLYTRVMSAAEYGAYDLLITFGVLANLLVALEIGQGLARCWPDANGRGEKLLYSSTSLVFALLMYGAFLFVTLLYSEQFSLWLLGDQRFVTAFRLGVGFIAVYGIYLIVLNQFRWELRSRAYAMVSVSYAVFLLLFVLVLCVVFDMELEGVMLAQLAAASVSLLISLWLLRSSYRLTMDIARLKEMLKFSAPLVPAGVAVFSGLYFNRFALSYYESLESVGVFALGARISGLASLMFVGVQAALTPLIYKHYREADTPARIARLFGWFLSVAFAGCLFLSLFARELILVFAGPGYEGGAGLVGILAPALLLSQMYIFAPGMAIRRKTSTQMWISILAAVAGAAGNVLLVPGYGIWGAAFATLMSSVVFFLLWVYASQGYYKVPYAYKNVAVCALLFVGAIYSGMLVNTLATGVLAGVLLKAGILLLMLVAVVVMGLLPVSDIKAGWALIRTRIRRRGTLS